MFFPRIAYSSFFENSTVPASNSQEKKKKHQKTKKKTQNSRIAKSGVSILSIVDTRSNHGREVNTTNCVSTLHTKFCVYPIPTHHTRTHAYTAGIKINTSATQQFVERNAHETSTITGQTLFRRKNNNGNDMLLTENTVGSPPGWTSAQDAAGRTYYYHPVTRETKWPTRALLPPPQALLPPQTLAQVPQRQMVKVAVSMGEVQNRRDTVNLLFGGISPAMSLSPSLPSPQSSPEHISDRHLSLLREVDERVQKMLVHETTPPVSSTVTLSSTLSSSSASPERCRQRRVSLHVNSPTSHTMEWQREHNHWSANSRPSPPSSLDGLKQARRVVAGLDHIGMLSKTALHDIEHTLKRNGRGIYVDHYGFGVSIRKAYNLHHPSTSQLHLEESTIEALWALLDHNRRGKIIIDEFVALVRSRLETPGHPAQFSRSPEKYVSKNRRRSVVGVNKMSVASTEHLKLSPIARAVNRRAKWWLSGSQYSKHSKHGSSGEKEKVLTILQRHVLFKHHNDHSSGNSGSSGSGIQSDGSGGSDGGEERDGGDDVCIVRRRERREEEYNAMIREVDPDDMLTLHELEHARRLASVRARRPLPSFSPTTTTTTTTTSSRAGTLPAAASAQSAAPPPLPEAPSAAKPPPPTSPPPHPSMLNNITHSSGR